MSAYPSWWALCGGWAADAWLGRQTRPHGDVDLAIWHDDQRLAFEYFGDGWSLLGDDNPGRDSDDPWDGRPLGFPAHIHARHGGIAGYLREFDKDEHVLRGGVDFDIQLEQRHGATWRLNPAREVALPIERCVAEHPQTGLLLLVPELLAFYKATAENLEFITVKRPEYVDDFRGLLPLLGDDGRAWLRTGIAAVNPDHPWLRLLE